MGQYWILVNLDKREKETFWKLGECASDFKIHKRLSGREFTVSTAVDYIEQLRADAERQRKRDEKYLAKALANGWPLPPVDVYRRVEQSQSALFSKLPIEVVSICVRLVDTLRDKACFALTCQDAWDIARPEIIKELRSYKTWEGDRILCIGDYTRLDDIPPNVFNEEELATLRDIKTGVWEPPSVSDDTSSTTSYEPTYLTDFLDARGVKSFFSPVEDVRKSLIKKDDDAFIPYDQRPHVLWSSMVTETCFNMNATGAVLRNLTTHEYVRGNACLAARKKDPNRRSPIQFWGLADILLLRIAWADDSCWKTMMGREDAHCAWAGHRFDFAHESRLPRDEKGRVLPPWKDVSKPLIKELLRCRGWSE